MARISDKEMENVTIYNCWFCGNPKEERELSSHHLIPRWCGGVDEDIVEVCWACHRKLDHLFTNFIKYGQFVPPHWQNQEKFRRRHNKWFKEYYRKNRERILKKNAEWKKNHRDTVSQYRKNYYEEIGK